MSFETFAMKITTINYNNYSYNPLLSNKKSASAKRNIRTDYFTSQQALSFRGILPYDIFYRTEKDPLKLFKNFTKEEYLQLTAPQIDILRKEFQALTQKNFQLKTIGELHAYIAECIETALNFELGKDNYVILSIGRSLSSICKSLETKLGEENVVNIPMSDARRFFNPYATNYQKNYIFIFEKIKEDPGLETFLEYLKSKNLSREVIENSNKQYVLMDYCISGDSLKGAEQLFKSELVWGNKKRNIHSADIFRILELFDETTLSHPLVLNASNTSIAQTVENLLWCTEFKEYATVGSSYCLKDTINAANEILNSGELSRAKQLVWFNLIDTIMSNKGNFNVKLKNEVSQKHFSTPIKQQRVEIWNTPELQYKNDVRDDLNELCNLLLKSSLKDPKQKNKASIKKLNNAYKFLTKCLFFSKDTKYQHNYYKKRAQIVQLLNRVNEHLNSIK